MEQPHGRRLVPSLIDSRARVQPTKTWASIQRGDGLGFNEVPWADLANAINRVAHWVLDTFGHPVKNDRGQSPVLAYIGASDLRYFVVPLAMIKIGYTVSLSHTNFHDQDTEDRQPRERYHPELLASFAILMHGLILGKKFVGAYPRIPLLYCILFFAAAILS